MPKLMKIEPASAFAEVNVGEKFYVDMDAGGRQGYHLHSRDPWSIYAVRYTRWDSFVDHVVWFVQGLFRKAS